MEIWIRSQDKYTLMKIEEIQICENPDGTWFMNAGIVLGKYKTKERALEVLDEIQKIILYACADFDEIPKDLKTGYFNFKTGVVIYEMPEE